MATSLSGCKPLSVNCRKESQLWLSLKNLLPLVHWQRVETQATGSGVPDVNGCIEAIEFWIELKIIVGVNKLRFREPLKPLQIAWMTKRFTAGGNCYILAENGNEWWVWSGGQARDLADNDLEKAAPRLKLKKPIDTKALLEFFMLGCII